MSTTSFRRPSSRTSRSIRVIAALGRYKVYIVQPSKLGELKVGLWWPRLTGNLQERLEGLGSEGSNFLEPAGVGPQVPPMLRYSTRVSKLPIPKQDVSSVLVIGAVSVCSTAAGVDSVDLE